MIRYNLNKNNMLITKGYLDTLNFSYTPCKRSSDT